jgi:2-polyprenyl-3-methyl-5-hydroxy-6-metoxy-1,4-benzoquinol methylase
MQVMDRSEKFWDRRASEYDRDEETYGQTYHETIESTRWRLSPGDVVLDYACGTGIITNRIAGSVKEVHAIDISSKMIAVARREAHERGVDNVYYAQSTIFEASYGQRAFDVILAFNILHLLEDAQRVVQRISELLKPGGLFISATPCMGEKKSLLSGMFFLLSKTGIAPYIRFPTFSELEGLVASGDLQIVETRDLHQRPPNYFIVAKKMEGTQSPQGAH